MQCTITAHQAASRASVLSLSARTFYTAFDKTKPFSTTKTNRNPRYLERVNKDHHEPGYYHKVFVDFSKAHVLGRLGYHTEEIIIVAETTDRIFQQLYSTRNVSASSHVGRLLGTRLQYAGITNVQLDLQGKKYHGKTKAFVDGIHEMGIITTENTKKIAAIHKLADKAK